jgi:hypothetical protein
MPAGLLSSPARPLTLLPRAVLCRTTHLQELAETMGLVLLNKRFSDPTCQVREGPTALL